MRLDDLAERPQRDAVAVREAAPLAPRDELGVRVDDAEQLVDEAALADAGNADERHELRRPRVSRALEDASRRTAELVLAADELGARLVRDVDAEARAGATWPSQTGIGCDFPFASTGWRLLVVDDRARRSVRSSRRRGSR